MDKDAIANKYYEHAQDVLRSSNEVNKVVGEVTTLHERLMIKRFIEYLFKDAKIGE